MNLKNEKTENLDVGILIDFLKSPLHCEDDVIERFGQLDGAVERGEGHRKELPPGVAAEIWNDNMRKKLNPNSWNMFAWKEDE